MVFYINLQDAAGLINVFKIDRPLFKDLCQYHGVPAENAEIILDSLYDWMDPDNFLRPHGAESEFYQKNYGYTAANRLIESQDELLLIRGFHGPDKNAFNKLGKLLDFSIESEGMNPNTMPVEAFRIFKGLGDEKINTIIQKRRQNEFEGPAELTLASGYNFNTYSHILQFFTSNTIYVKIKAYMPMEERRFYYIMSRLDQVAAAGAMRGESEHGAAPGAVPRNLEEDFGYYFHTFSLQEGTGLD
jgi:type II secretory pathway component PulK